MRSAALIAAVFAMMLMIPGMAQAADEEATLTGEPVDIPCYLGGKAGEAHASCAKACAERGNPIGLAVGEGDEKELYLVLGASGKQAKDVMGAHMGKQVKVTGTVTEKNGMKVITVSKVEA